MMFGGNFAPRGWAFCDGQLLPISQNTALFSLLGTTYGGDGRTTFGLPDLRGRVPMHPGNGPGLTSRNLGAKGGRQYVSLVGVNLPPHHHAISSDTANGGKVMVTATTTPVTTASLKVGKEGMGSTPTDTAAGNYIGKSLNTGNKIYRDVVNPSGELQGLQVNVTADTTVAVGGTTQDTGSGASFDIMQPFTAVYFIIALQGIFPSRN